MILYLDTSGPFMHLALYGDRLIDKYEINSSKDLSTIAVSKIKEFLNKNEIEMKDISIIFLVNGPGSYTGTRIGATFAKVSSWALNIKVIEVSSLEVLLSSVEEDNVVAIIDARRANTWAQAKVGGINESLGHFIKLEELISKFPPENFTYITNAQNKLDINYQVIKPHYEKIINKYINRNETPTHLIDVNYLKKTEAEENYDNRNSL